MGLAEAQPSAPELRLQCRVSRLQAVLPGLPGFHHRVGDELAAGLAEAFAIGGIVRRADAAEERLAAERNLGAQPPLELAAQGGKKPEGDREITPPEVNHEAI